MSKSPRARSLRALPLALAALGGAAVAVPAATAWVAQDPVPEVGYDDTPVLPDQQWRVHDGHRPQPRVIAPADTVGAPPADAIVLFDGSDLSAWTGNGGEARWKVENGYAEVNGTGGIRTRQEFRDIQLHLEFATPTEVRGNSQGRGNSGVFFMNAYELQILDSFQNPSYPDGQAAAMYGQFPPLVNASRGPGQWQTYDVIFKAPVFDGNEVVKPAHITVFHNGVAVHDAQEFIGRTAHRNVAQYSAHADTGPIQLQDHGNPIRFRNIWVRELRGYDQ